jgi:hypothetical protein
MNRVTLDIIGLAGKLSNPTCHHAFKAEVSRIQL